jgi:cobalt-zinc-cadmium efflux system outer membrane protein
MMIYFKWIRHLFVYLFGLIFLLSVKTTCVVAQNNPVSNISSSNEFVRRALTANAELATARLDIERARARLQQAGLRPNPTIDFEQTTGKLTNTRNESAGSIGFAMPVELGGKRRRRLDLAQTELAVAEAEITDRERRLAAEVRTIYIDVLAILRELETMQRLNELDLQTARTVEVRVKEGDVAPLELNLLRVEVDRLKSRRTMLEGRLQATLMQLKSIAGMSLNSPLSLEEDLALPITTNFPPSLTSAIELALQTRPDLRIARLREEAAQAGLRLAKAESIPDMVLFAKYSRERSAFDNTPVGIIRDKDNLVSFGVSIGVPLFNRNQGAQNEAAIAISQARRYREFLEQVVQTQVTAAYTRYISIQAAITAYEQGVIVRSMENIRVFREVYSLGELRITELIAEQRRLVDSQREYTELLAERYRAFSDLLSAIGTNSF